MNKRSISLVFFILLLMIFVIPPEVFAEKEDTAHLHFEKNANRGQGAGNYTVQKGDWVANIIRKEMHIESYTDIIKVIKQIQVLNPTIKNLDVIHPGQTLHMPSLYPEKDAPTENIPGKVYADSKSEQTETTPEKQEIGKPEAFVPDVKNLEILKHIISKINGSFLTQGLYHIPLPKSGQVTIDCEKIPVVEFDDGSTVLLDFANSMPIALKGLIQTSWKHYHIVTYSINDNIFIILQKIIKSSKSYNMIQMAKMFNLPDKSILQIYCDWMISKKTTEDRWQYIQALSFLNDSIQLLPQKIVDFMKKNGLRITEIVDQHGIMMSQIQNETIPDITKLYAPTNADLIFSLLATLGYTPSKDADVRVYNKIKDGGYNLTVKVDYLVKKNDRNYVINSDQMTRQLLDILKEEGVTVILFNNKDKSTDLVDKILKSMNIPYSYNTFSFSLPEKGITRASINFPAFRISENDEEPVFLIDFDMDKDIYASIQDIWRLKIIKY